MTRKINDFLASPCYILLVMLLTTVANAFAMELAVYTVFVLLGVYICLRGRDLLPLVPLVVGGYLSPSVGSNPGKNEKSIFAIGHGGAYMLVLAAIVVVALAVYMIRERKRFFSQKRKLLPGIMALTVAYCLGGILSPAYPELATRHIAFALLQGAAILVPYYVISGGVRWDKARRDYFCWTGFGTGCLLLAQLIWIYLTGNITENGVIKRNLIYTGWGMHNNLGGILAMMIPFAFYLAARYHRGWIGTVAGTAFLTGVFMSCSRSSILAGCGIYLLCLVLMFRFAKNPKGNWTALIVALTVGIVAVVAFRHQLAKLFWGLISMGADPSHRDEIWGEGMKQFVKYPVFGGSFYPIGYVPWDFSEVASFSGFFPPRWHNTLVQLLASTGVVGVLGYGFHRVQTVKLLIRDFTVEKAFIGCSILVLVGTSMLDCHMFNIGPVLFYAMGLAFAEHCTKE